MIPINLFRCQEKAFILRNLCMIAKNLINIQYRKKMNSNLNIENVTNSDYIMQRFYKDFISIKILE